MAFLSKLKGPATLLAAHCPANVGQEVDPSRAPRGPFDWPTRVWTYQKLRLEKSSEEQLPTQASWFGGPNQTPLWRLGSG